MNIIIYFLIGDNVSDTKEENQSNEDDNELGGLFRMASRKNIKKQSEKETANDEDVSKFDVEYKHDWNLSEVKTKII